MTIKEVLIVAFMYTAAFSFPMVLLETILDARECVMMLGHIFIFALIVELVFGIFFILNAIMMGG